MMTLAAMKLYRVGHLFCGRRIVSCRATSLQTGFIDAMGKVLRNSRGAVLLSTSPKRRKWSFSRRVEMFFVISTREPH
jgi:hypothetical protein